MQDFNRELDQLLSMTLPPLAPLPSGDYVIYGAGNIGREIAERLAGCDKKVRAFIDKRPLPAISGAPVYAPDSREARKFAGEGMTAIIGVFNYAADPHEIRTLLEKLGYKRIISFLEFHAHFHLPPHFWLTARNYVLEHSERVRTAAMLLADDRSRNIFLDTLRLRLTLDTSLLCEPDLDGQYTPADLPHPTMPLRFIDAGAFDGDTIESLLARGAAFEAVAAFEPDPKNYAALCATARRLDGRLGDATLWPCGLNDVSRVASFCAGKEQASVVSADGDIHIQLVALDDAMPAFRPNYIKFDIEGSELAALRGGAGMIRKHQPAIAVCVYHRPEDLWEIPIYLREILPDHGIALRYHKFQGFDMVAYALPSRPLEMDRMPG
jgi:FkbM family methyltransferase